LFQTRVTKADIRTELEIKVKLQPTKLWYSIWTSDVDTGGGIRDYNPPSFVANVTSHLVTFIRILQNLSFILFSTFRLLFKYESAFK